jgi:hypothetical protein
MLKLGVVIPCSEDRVENLNQVLKCIAHEDLINEIVSVCDGWFNPDVIEIEIPKTTIIGIEKHHPGKEQPRNVGVRWLSNSNHVWFLDSDVIVERESIEAYHEAYNHSPAVDRIMIGPYEWMHEGEREPNHDLHNDPRWEMFNEYDYKTTFVGNIGAALGNFSGNLVWPVKEFKKAGGFWHELSAGRVEDGELGIRAASLSIPMCVVPKARGWHMYHGGMPNPTLEWIDYATKINEREVPKIHERHGQIEKEGLRLTHFDGARFDFECPGCDQLINTGLYWEHAGECEKWRTVYL